MADRYRARGGVYTSTTHDLVILDGFFITLGVSGVGSVDLEACEHGMWRSRRLACTIGVY
jgi:hypothetical protein